MLPLFFQVVLLDSASQAGARLAIPSLATPIGGLIAGFTMSRYGKLIPLVRLGVFFMTIGNALVTALQFKDSTWKYYLFIVPANLGQGITYPATLFTNIATFEHSGKCGLHWSALFTAQVLISISDHAVSASTVYLIRSMGTVWGVAITSAIVQTVLKNELPTALSGISDKAKASIVGEHQVDIAVANLSSVHRGDTPLSNRAQRSTIISAAACKDSVLQWHSLRICGFDCVCGVGSHCIVVR